MVDTACGVVAEKDLAGEIVVGVVPAQKELRPQNFLQHGLADAAHIDGLVHGVMRPPQMIEIVEIGGAAAIVVLDIDRASETRIGGAEFEHQGNRAAEHSRQAGAAEIARRDLRQHNVLVRHRKLAAIPAELVEPGRRARGHVDIGTVDDADSGARMGR
jgi:hypothetical protein